LGVRDLRHPSPLHCPDRIRRDLIDLPQHTPQKIKIEKEKEKKRKEVFVSQENENENENEKEKEKGKTTTFLSPQRLFITVVASR
jgi:hypothetical protein